MSEYNNDTCEVPFIEQLRCVPEDFRVTREAQWDSEGIPISHQSIPVGFMFYRAAKVIETANARIAELEADINRYLDHVAKKCTEISELEAENARLLARVAEFENSPVVAWMHFDRPQREQQWSSDTPLIVKPATNPDTPQEKQA